VSIPLRRDGAPPSAAARARGAAAAREHVVADASPVYVGLVTRAIAFAVDGALINIAAIATAAVVALGFSVVSIPEELRTVAVAAGGALYALWTVGYFVTFWATTGQTPGSRIMRIAVQTASGEQILPRRALLRFVGLTLAALPLFAGFLLILFDDRRRGFHDHLARTVVVNTDAPGASGTRRGTVPR
jgi:uncharacterized RDD family membrane protein YckC